MKEKHEAAAGSELSCSIVKQMFIYLIYIEFSFAVHPSLRLIKLSGPCSNSVWRIADNCVK